MEAEVGRPRLERAYFVQGIGDEVMSSIGSYLFDDLSITTLETPQLRKAEHGKMVRVYACTIEQRDHFADCQAKGTPLKIFEQIGENKVLKLWKRPKKPAEIMKPMSLDQVKMAVARVSP